jgi:hypothetical protein
MKTSPLLVLIFCVFMSQRLFADGIKFSEQDDPKVIIKYLASEDKKQERDDKKMREAILRLGQLGGDDTKPVLQAYADRANIKRSSNIEGAAQAALARLGDEQSMQAIIKELSSDDPIIQSDAFVKLGMVGNSKAIRVLAPYLVDCKCPKSKEPMPPVPEGKQKQDDVEYFPRCHLAAKALAKAVANPPTLTNPDFYTEDDIAKWREWWNAHKTEYQN